MADDARQAELRADMLRTLCVDHGHDRREGGMNCRTCHRRVAALLPIVSAWAEQYAARRAAEELGEALGKAATLGPLEAVAWMARRHAALTPATEEQS